MTGRTQIRKIEQRVIDQLLDEMLAAGFAISVDYGDDDEYEVSQSTDKAEILKALWACDEEILHYRGKDPLSGWIRLIYGEDGYDVMQDYTVNLDAFIPKTLKLIDDISEGKVVVS